MDTNKETALPATITPDDRIFIILSLGFMLGVCAERKDDPKRLEHLSKRSLEIARKLGVTL